MATASPVRIPPSLRAAAQFPAEEAPQTDATVWAQVLGVAARELAAAARDAGGWSTQAQSQVLGALDEATRLLTVAKAPVLAAQETAGTWRASGARRFEDYRATQTRAGKATTHREINASRAVQELDGGLDALTDGILTPAHADRLGTIADKLPDEHKNALLTGEGAEKIKDLARRHDATRFAGKVEDLAAAMSAKGVEDAHQAARARRQLELTPAGDGITRISGVLDNLAAHTLQVALEAATPRPAADDTRTPRQRKADALLALAEAGLAGAKTTGNARSQVLITMSDETFVQARNHLRAGDHPCGHPGASGTSGESGTPGAAGATPTDLGPAPVVRYQDGPLLPLSEIARTLCDSDIARLVIGAGSHPLDLGRNVRLFTPAQRRAVIARDQGCAWDGCTMPARYGEVHHLDWFDDDHGHTNTDRAVLVCSYHHHELHRRHLDIVRDTEPPRAGHGTALPGDREYEPPRYRLVPRSQTRTPREEGRQTRLLADVRADAAARRAKRALRRTSLDDHETLEELEELEGLGAHQPTFHGPDHVEHAG